MAQSLAKIYTHIVFSTKGRQPLLQIGITNELYPYMATVLKGCESPAINIGGMPDHIHILCLLSKNHAICKIIEEAKKRSSKWLKTKGQTYEDFKWQNGYGAFSVSQSQLLTVQNYIKNQANHHKKLTFQEEFRNFLEKYQIDYDERYVWD